MRAGRPRKRAFADTITSVCLVTYLVVMLWGGVSSTGYALEYGQRAATSWRPPMAPIKIIMTFGIFLMLLQTDRLLLPRPRAGPGPGAIE